MDRRVHCPASRVLGVSQRTQTWEKCRRGWRSRDESPCSRACDTRWHFTHRDWCTSFQICMHLFLSHPPINVSLQHRLNRSGESGEACLVPKLTGSAFTTIKHDVSCRFYILHCHPLEPMEASSSFTEGFSYDLMCNLVKCFSCVSVE